MLLWRGTRTLKRLSKLAIFTQEFSDVGSRELSSKMGGELKDQVNSEAELSVELCGREGDRGKEKKKRAANKRQGGSLPDELILTFLVSPVRGDQGI